MTVLAVIPARGGSKGVPGKNLAPVGGVPLVVRAVREALAAPLVTDVAVSTDDPGIAAAARAAGAWVVDRPAGLSGDTASSEAAVLHALDAFGAAHGARVRAVLLVQCTSPFLTREDIQGVAAAVVRDGADSAVTVAPFHGFVWREGADPGPDTDPGPGKDTGPGPGLGTASSGVGVNHDAAVRPRRQDRPRDHLETGAAYAMDAEGFRAARHRFFGRTALVRTDPARVLEIDDPHDLARARALAPLLDTAARGTALPTRADIDAVVLDFDGTQTDDRAWIDAEGRETVAVHRGDGLGVARLREAGLDLLILSTERNPVVAVERVERGQQPGADEVVVPVGLAHPEVGEDGGGNGPVQGFERRRGRDGDQQIRTVQDLPHVPVDQPEVGRQRAGGLPGEPLVRELLQVSGVLTGARAELEQHLTARVEPGVPDQPAQYIGAFGAARGDGGLGGEDQRVAPLLGPVGRAAEERQRGLDHGGGIGSDPFVHLPEAPGVLPGVGEHEIRAVAQQQPVGQLLVDDADIAGDHDGAAGRGQGGEPVQHGLDTAADQREDDHVAAAVRDGAQKLRTGHLVQRARLGADLGELAGRGRGPAAQQVSGRPGRAGDEAARGQRTPFPPGVGIGEYGDTRGAADG